MNSISQMTEMLVPLDRSEASARAVPVAGRIAGRLGIGIRLLGVSDETEEMTVWLEYNARRLPSGIDTAVEVVAGGDPAAAIVTKAADEDLVCMATGATLLPHRGHVGSVAEGVVRQIRRPVALVGPEVEAVPGERTEKVVVPVDGSELSERSLDVAADLARKLDVPVWVVSVVSPKVGAAAGAHFGEMPPAAESGYVRHLAGSLSQRYDVDAQYEVLHMDDPAMAIVDFAGDDGAVVMSTHGRSGASRVFAGSVATGVVAGSRRPVIVWRPFED